MELGKLASKKAGSAEVRSFGERMVKDHSKANAELAKIAKSKGAAPADTAGPEHAGNWGKLNKATGAEFDREYMKAMREDHKKAVSLFEKQAKSGDDADLKAFAAKTLPVLREHGKLAEKAADTGKGKK